MTAAPMLFALPGLLALQGLGAVQPSFELDPPTVAVGEPTVLTLAVRHPSAVRVAIGELELDDSWVVFDEVGRATRPDPSSGGRALTTRSYELASLEPGERALPTVTLSWNEGDVRRQLDVEPATLIVTGVLGPDEDAPRPLVGFRDVEDVPRAPLRPVALATLSGLVAAGLAVGGVVLLRRRRRRTGSDETWEPSPLATLATLAPGSEPAPVHYALTRALRRAAAARADFEIADGETDREWVARLADVDARLAADVEALLARCERVKYAAERPTELAVRETLDEARALVGRLEQGPGSRTGEGAS